MNTPDPDRIDRTVLIAMHDGTAETFEAAVEAHASTGVIIVGDAHICSTMGGQAALLTAVTTAVRAFGNVRVIVASPQDTILAGVNRGQALGAAVEVEGAQIIPADKVSEADQRWPILLIGPTASVSTRAPAAAPVLRAQWRGWTATVGPARPQTTSGAPQDTCILAAIAAAAMGISEVFNVLRGRQGSDAGYRDASLNLWNPGKPDDVGPALRHAPAQWWLVGLGHLGQAYSWVLSWLDYAQPSKVQVVLQDTDRTTPANHSTGMLTQSDSTDVLKTRLIAAALDAVGYDTRIIERRLDNGLKVSSDDVHVALLGVDNLPARRLISTVGWRFAIDAGLGAGPADFSSILLRRFPGKTPSTDVVGWTESQSAAAVVPDTPAFTDLRGRTDACGLAELAGKAAGASFVGAVAATLAVAEAVRELHDGQGIQVTAVSLDNLELSCVAATSVGDVISLPLRDLLA